jgi:rhamnose utilization protein RhaD (predicted bifunctional aldolase and dehydrogenase)
MLDRPFTELPNQIKDYCSEIGKNRLLVQGPGGNISWKADNVIWIKASGQWLAKANDKEIFVPVDLAHLRRCFSQENFNVVPKLKIETILRPSIETAFHAVLPHRIVVHLHAVEILALLVQDDCKILTNNLNLSNCIALFLEYYKPGAELAKKIQNSLYETPNINVIFLRNHGVIVGGDTLEEIKNLISELIIECNKQLNNKKKNKIIKIIKQPMKPLKGWQVITDKELNLFITDKFFVNNLKKNWALYPDHVVFLGPSALAFNHKRDFESWLIDNPKKLIETNVIFIKDSAILLKDDANDAVLPQLYCYLDVLLRQPIECNLTTLTKHQVSELIDWDAEKYRSSN